jgi:site-specific DNA recombinase
VSGELVPLNPSPLRLVEATAGARPTKAIGYVRRSRESGARTVSLNDQRERITAYAAERGWQLAEVLVDDGVSGGRRERLERIADRVRTHRAGVVVVYHLDRFARDVAGLLDSLRSFSRRGVELHVVGRGRIETDTASGFLVVGVEGLMAEHYRRLIGEKTRDALARLRATGRRAGELPYGWTVNGDGETLLPVETEQAVLAAILDRRATGVGYRRIAAELNAEGVPTKHGRQWWPETVRSVLAHARFGDNHRPVVVHGSPR